MPTPHTAAEIERRRNLTDLHRCRSEAVVCIDSAERCAREGDYGEAQCHLALAEARLRHFRHYLLELQHDRITR